MKGAVTGVHDSTPPEEIARVDLQIILQTTLIPDDKIEHNTPGQKPHLACYAAMVKDPK